MKVIAIIWLDWDSANPTAARAATLNAPSISAGIQAANAYSDTIIRVSCGSEFVSANVNSNRSNTGELNNAIGSCISQLKNAGVTQPVTSIDTWWEWCNASYPCAPRDLASQADWIGVNVFPWWENKFSGLFSCTSALFAPDFTLARVNDVKAVYPSKDVMLTEFGWPRGPDGYSETNINTGQQCGVASEQNHEMVLSQTLAALDLANISAGIFEAFREDWKAQTEPPVGPYWGDCDGTPPYTCQFSNYLWTRAEIALPFPGNTLPGSTVTFTWTTAAGADKYWLDVGTSVGVGDISAGETTDTARTVNLPTNGLPVYVRLWTHKSGYWLPPFDYVYQASGQSQLTSPPPGSTLTSTSVTFAWNAAPGADYYWLDVGNSVAHGDIFAGQIMGTSQMVSNLPCDGRTLYVQLWNHIAGAWQPPQRYTYTAVSGGCAAATITSPQPNSTFDSFTNSVQFTWSSISGADYYWLDVGNTVAMGDIFARQLTGTSQTVGTIPCDGRTIYVQLWTHINGAWLLPQRYSYTAWNGCARLVQSAPYIGGTVMFMWTAAPAGASEYWLDVGTAPGIGNLFGQNVGTALTQRVEVPIFLAAVYVQLWSKIGGVWYLNRYTFKGLQLGG